MNFLVSEFESRGYTWAYRVVDARSFGVPQRRQRVMMLASWADDPRSVLFADEATTPGFDDTIGVPDPEAVYGFYWTEGLRGLGWAKNSVPTIKGGSGLGIPSPPAVWIPATGEVGTPQLEDAERMQGFPVDWTYPAVDAGFRVGERWKMVGNAVCVNMSEWVGSRLLSPGQTTCASSPLESGSRWPMAAWGRQGERYAVDASMYPIDSRPNLSKFLTMPLRPLSAKATAGFLSRARRGNLRFADGFLAALDSHLQSLN